MYLFFGLTRFSDLYFYKNSNPTDVSVVFLFACFNVEIYSNLPQIFESIDCFDFEFPAFPFPFRF